GGLVTCRSMAWAARAQCHVSYQKTESRDKTMAHTRRDFLQASLSMAGLSFIGLPAFAQADGNLIVAYNTGVPSWDPTTGPSGVNPKLQPIYLTVFDRYIQQRPDLSFEPGLLTEWGFSDD